MDVFLLLKQITMKIKERILTGWTCIRALYLVIGGFVIIQSIMTNQWFGVVFGGYFASMGLFAFGCAAGNCPGSRCTAEPGQKSQLNIRGADFEEVKTR